MPKSMKDKKNSSLIPIKKGITQTTSTISTSKPISASKRDSITVKKSNTVTKSTTNSGTNDKVVIERSLSAKMSTTTGATTTKVSQVQKPQKPITIKSDNMTVIHKTKKKKTEADVKDKQLSGTKEKKVIRKATTSSNAATIIDCSTLEKKGAATMTTTITQADMSFRSQSAMHYANKDSITFEHGEIPSSLPSSPSHLKRPNSSNGNNVMTSEVFTRTVDSSKSIEVIYRQPCTSSTQDSIRTKCVSEIDASFIETTDSSLSDSIALPSSTSDHGDMETIIKRKPQQQLFSPISPTATKIPLQLIESKSRKAEIPSTIADVDESSEVTGKSVNVDKESISPMLEFQAVSPQRQKYKFNYELSITGN